MILALLETDVACCTFHVDDDEIVRAIKNAEKQEERSHQYRSRQTCDFCLYSPEVQAQPF